MKRGTRRPSVGALVMAGALIMIPALRVTSGAQAAEAEKPNWGRSIAITTTMAASLYAGALLISSATKFAITEAAPILWQRSLQTYAVPGVMVLVMSQLIPSAKTTVPELVDGWLEKPARTFRLSQRGSEEVSP